MIDFHAHILPEMDDGSRSVEMIRWMLLLSKLQGVNRIVATPHFYADCEDPATFLRRRSESMEKIRPIYAEHLALPELLLGAEVHYFDGMSVATDIEHLCIQGTKLMLIEMPFRSWTASMIDELSKVQSLGITPILAHIDRYEAFRKDKLLKRLQQLGFVIQINADALLHGLHSARAIYTVQNGNVHILGSDCHSIGIRKPNLRAAKEVIERKCGSSAMKTLDRNAENLLNM